MPDGIGFEKQKRVNVMPVANVDQILQFCKREGQLLSLPEFEADYGFEPDGANFYYGINSDTVQRFQMEGAALNQTHQAFLERLLEAHGVSVVGKGVKWRAVEA